MPFNGCETSFRHMSLRRRRLTKESSNSEESRSRFGPTFSFMERPEG